MTEHDPRKMFATLFTGRPDVYGVHVPEAVTQESGVKLQGKSFTRRESVTLETYLRHLNGQESIGIVPIMTNGCVYFAAIDIDVYPINPEKYCKIFHQYRLPLVCFRSKSGGLHAYIFFRRPEKAQPVIDILRQIVSILGLKKETEIFPKQARSDDVGNWINIPYFNTSDTSRYAYNSLGEPMQFDSAMNWCWGKLTSVEELGSILQRMPFADAPPCLQTLYINEEINSDNHNRNKFLFNATVYLKARNKDDFADRVRFLNKSLPEPMDEQELDRTVLKSHQTADYSYQCDEPWLKTCCNKALCEKRKFGKGSMYVTDFTFEQLTQINGDSPYYKWIVNGQEMFFYSESELRRQEKFADYCIRYLHKCPNQLKQNVWIGIINQALANIIVEEVPTVEQLSDKTLLIAHLYDFIRGRQLAQAPEQILLERTYYDEGRRMYCFRIADFVQFLELNKRFKLSSYSKLHNILRNAGACSVKLYLPEHQRQLRVWGIPEEFFDAIEMQDDKPLKKPSKKSKKNLFEVDDDIDDFKTGKKDPDFTPKMPEKVSINHTMPEKGLDGVAKLKKALDEQEHLKNKKTSDIQFSEDFLEDDF